jgi:hypothetical protein
MPDINLLKSESHDRGANTQFAARLLARLLLVLVLLAFIGYGALFYIKRQDGQKLDEVKKNVQSLQSEALANKDRNELVTRQEQLTQLETLIDNHVYWSNLLPELARVTLKSAKYSSIAASKDGNLNLTVSLASYDDVEKYLQIFDLPEYNKEFSNVRIVSLDHVQEDDNIAVQLKLQLTFDSDYIKAKGQD